MENIFRAAAIAEANFEMQMAESGYERKTTFYADLTIAEYYREEGIRDTFQNVCESWLDNYEFFTEFIMCLNLKCWEHYEKGNNKLSGLYSDLYYKARDKYLEKYDGDEEKLMYYYRTTD